MIDGKDAIFKLLVRVQILNVKAKFLCFFQCYTLAMRYRLLPPVDEFCSDLDLFIILSPAISFFQKILFVAS